MMFPNTSYTQKNQNVSIVHEAGIPLTLRSHTSLIDSGHLKVPLEEPHGLSQSLVQADAEIDVAWQVTSLNFLHPINILL